jgi:SAM-dependent methyltransferase
LVRSLSGPAGEQCLWRYRQPFVHQSVSALIRRFSTHPEDIRDVALAGVDLSEVREVLELGCGFGFMAEKLARRIHPAARITGVDACRDNRRPFEERVRAAGRRAKFIWMAVEDSLPWRDGSYDLVVASHSLYYFPAVIPEIARVLHPGGRLLTVTHSEEACHDLCRLAGVETARCTLLNVVSRFSAENGQEKLGGSFAEVERIDYPNTLQFQGEEIEQLLAYLRFKFRFMNEWPESERELLDAESESLRARLLAGGSIELAKDDAVFWCARPLWGPDRPGYDLFEARTRPPAGFWHF